MEIKKLYTKTNIEEYLKKKNSSKPSPFDIKNEDGTFTSFAEQVAVVTHYLKLKDQGVLTQNFIGKAEKYLKLWYELSSNADKRSNAFVTDGLYYDDFFRDTINSHFPAPHNPTFRFIDLFAGIGGFRLAMQAQGGECVFSSEFNDAAQKTYYHNYGEVPFGDITKRETKNYIPQDFDVLCAGFPCQAFSIAGYQRGFEDTRGTLFFEVANILEEHRPKVAFLENVKNLEKHDGGRTFNVICNTLRDLGYEPYYKVLNACEYANVPQNRERIIIVAFNTETVPNHADFRFPDPIPLERTIHDCIEDGGKSEKYYYREGQIYYDRLVKGMNSQETVYQWRRIYVRENKNNLCPTLTANMGGGGHNVPLILTDAGIRKFTPKECLNFMGYPQNFEFPTTISESKMYMQAGNSVVVPMMTRVAEQIINIIV